MAEHMYESPKGVDLHRLLLHYQEELLTKLSAPGLFTHPTAKGDITENAWRDLISKFLPSRYQVSKAFVLDARGNTSQQIDVVVHDRHFCPLLFEQGDQRYIPAESVFAVFEVRQDLDLENVRYAAEKAKSVRSLHRTSREVVDRGQVKPPRELFEILAGVLTVRSSWSPPFGGALTDALASCGVEARIQLGCSPVHGAFEALYEGALSPRLEISEDRGAVLFFLLRLFQRLQAIGSPMAIDFREYTRPLEETPASSEERRP